MKSQTFLKISTLIIGVSALAGNIGIAPSANAMDISTSAVDPNLLPIGTEINGKRYWSVAEMQTASDLINAKREEFCQGDRMCREELPWQQMDEFGGIYRALDPYENIHFMLTSVNPSANTVKFLYHDEDKMLSRMLGETVRHDIASIYAVWVDESLGSITTTSSNWLAYGQRAPYHLGTVEEVEAATHLVFDESETELGAGWFTPNTEREYHVEDSNLTDNTNGQIHFSLNATEGGGHSHGTLDYSSCIKSPEYITGMECKTMFSEDGSRVYLPFVVASIPTDNPAELSEPISNPIEPDNPTSPITDYPDTPTNANGPITSTDAGKQSSTEITNEPNVTERIIYVTIKDPTSPTQTLAVATPRNDTTTSSIRTVQVASSTDKANLAENTNDREDPTICSDLRENSTVEIPLAATPTASDDEAEHVFPWWLIVFMFFGSAFFIFSWWFLLPLFKRRDDEDE